MRRWALLHLPARAFAGDCRVAERHGTQSQSQPFLHWPGLGEYHQWGTEENNRVCGASYILRSARATNRGFDESAWRGALLSGPRRPGDRVVRKGARGGSEGPCNDFQPCSRLRQERRHGESKGHCGGTAAHRAKLQALERGLVPLPIIARGVQKTVARGLHASGQQGGPAGVSNQWNSNSTDLCCCECIVYGKKRRRDNCWLRSQSPPHY